MIVVIIVILIVAVWAAVGLSLAISRQATLDDTKSEGRNLAAAFRGEIAFILRGLEGEMGLIAAKLQREGPSFDLYAWGQQNVLVAPGLANATILGADGKVRSTTRDPTPRRSMPAIAFIFASIWTESFTACSSARRSWAVRT